MIKLLKTKLFWINFSIFMLLPLVLSIISFTFGWNPFEEYNITKQINEDFGDGTPCNTCPDGITDPALWLKLWDALLVIRGLFITIFALKYLLNIITGNR